jgi:hypothetical protein
LDYDRQQVKMQDPIQRNVGNLNNVICKVGTHFWNIKKKDLKAKIDKLGANSKSKISETSIDA